MLGFGMLNLLVVDSLPLLWYLVLLPFWSLLLQSCWRGKTKSDAIMLAALGPVLFLISWLQGMIFAAKLL